MIVTFVGGPLHGTHEKWGTVPNRYWAEQPNGTKVLYEVRSQTGEGVGSNPIVWSHTTYAVVGTSLDEYFDLAREVRPPLHLD